MMFCRQRLENKRFRRIIIDFLVINTVIRLVFLMVQFSLLLWKAIVVFATFRESVFLFRDQMRFIVHGRLIALFLKRICFAMIDRWRLRHDWVRFRFLRYSVRLFDMMMIRSIVRNRLRLMLMLTDRWILIHRERDLISRLILMNGFMLMDRWMVRWIVCGLKSKPLIAAHDLHWLIARLRVRARGGCIRRHSGVTADADIAAAAATAWRCQVDARRHLARGTVPRCKPSPEGHELQAKALNRNIGLGKRLPQGHVFENFGANALMNWGRGISLLRGAEVATALAPSPNIVVRGSGNGMVVPVVVHASDSFSPCAHRAPVGRDARARCRRRGARRERRRGASHVHSARWNRVTTTCELISIKNDTLQQTNIVSFVFDIYSPYKSSGTRAVP